jgi:hypothetical protein
MGANGNDEVQQLILRLTGTNVDYQSAFVPSIVRLYVTAKPQMPPGARQEAEDRPV